MPMEGLKSYIWSLNTGVELYADAGVTFSLNISWVLSAPIARTQPELALRLQP